jgi:DNA-binding response OmpR family regulator
MTMIYSVDIPAVTALHDAFGLTAKEALVLLALAKGRILEHRRICQIYCDNPNQNEIEARSCIKRIRIKLRGTKINIRSHYGVGYQLSPGSAQAVRDIMARHMREAC